MARFKHPSTKQKLIKIGGQTKWAPYWSVFKKYGTGRKVHPGRHTTIKRSWRRTKARIWLN